MGTVVVYDCGEDDGGRRYSYSGCHHNRRWPEPGPAARDTIGRRPSIEQLAPVTAGRCSYCVLARIQLISACTDLAAIQLIVCAFSCFFFFFQYIGSLLPRSTSSTTRRARSSTKHHYCARIIHFYIVLFLIATFPSAILADGGGSGECTVSFPPLSSV